MSRAIVCGVIGLALLGCAPTQMYWVKQGVGAQLTAKDLFECRQAARQTSERQIYTGLELEAPCMGAKGYTLSEKPPTSL